MDIKITQSNLSGEINAPPSKSFAHRILISAYLSGKKISVYNIGSSIDATVTLEALKVLGAKIEYINGGVIIEGGTLPKEEVLIDCKESGSSLRFLLPVVSALGVKAKFTGCGRLLERPMTPLIDCLNSGGADIQGLTVKGKLKKGTYQIDGSVSSQYITGLIFALSIIGGEIKIIGKLVSQPYIDITLSVLKDFGVEVQKTASGYKILAGYNPEKDTFTVEGDWSGTAFPISAGAICGEVTVNGVNLNSTQGDGKILSVLKSFGANILGKGNSVTVKKAPLSSITLDCEDIPDLVQIIAVVASFAKGKTVLKNVSRLTLKESDRIQAVINTLNVAGIKAEYIGEDLHITGGTPNGGVFSGGNDHRTVMSSAVMALGASGNSLITGVEACKKSYPEFFEDIKKLGGNLSGKI